MWAGEPQVSCGVAGRLAQSGRALASHARGRWFKSSIAHQVKSAVSQVNEDVHADVGPRTAVIAVPTFVSEEHIVAVTARQLVGAAEPPDEIVTSGAGNGVLVVVAPEDAIVSLVSDEDVAEGVEGLEVFELEKCI